MLDYIAMYPNPHENELNYDFLNSTFDKPLDYYVIACMKDFESVSNIELLDYKIIKDQDEVDYNNHMVNINYKRKDLESNIIPQYSYMLHSRFNEIDFKFRVSTNLNENVFIKRILVPTEHDGYYLINGKKMRPIWQMVDASTYSRRGQITMKSRMPIIIYCNKHKITPDVFGNEFVLPTYSYAQDSSRKLRRGKATTTKKKSAKFINPLLIYLTKLGLKRTIEFWGMQGIVKIKKNYTTSDEKKCYIFACNDIYITARKDIFDECEMVKAFVCMFVNLQNRDFPVTMDVMEDKEYWTCRVGYIGSVKNKSLLSFLDKGKTSIHMIERLYDFFSYESLRLPEIYKGNIYRILYWMITDFDAMKQRVNIDMENKRIRKNEVFVSSTLGRKIAENINKLIERKPKSKMNNMDTLLEMFNFNSDIIVTGMKSMNDLIKGDTLSNDMMFLSLFEYSNKGPNSLGSL